MGTNKWPEAIAVCVVALSACICIRGWPDLSDTMSQTFAAWVGALGTILAIVGTFLSTRWQFERTSRAQWVAQQALREAEIEIAVAIAVDAVEALDEVKLQLRSRKTDRFRLRTARLEDAQYALRGLMQRALPYGMATPLLDLQRAVSRTLRDVEQWYHATGPISDDRAEQFLRRYDRACRSQSPYRGCFRFRFVDFCSSL
jgi:hypothetical protein